ncbi:MAG: hypothetical protein JWQ78_1617, partial [Sediminibacterium sp.]|nr:hypothetical protein [Sediminibacterium sp.]
AAQHKPVVYQQQSWVGYYPQVKFSKHWGLWFDSEIHTNDHYFNGFSQATFRLAGTYYNNRLNKFTVGYGYTDFFPGENHAFVSIPEHFAWQQYQWYHNTRKHKLMQWLRLEERFKNDVVDNYTAADTYTFTYRARYNVYYQLPLTKKGLVAHSLAVAMGDELYLYYGPRVQNHVFDQNRVFLGLSYAVNGHDNLVLGVMNMLQEDLSGQFKDNNVLRLSFFQNVGTVRHVE